MNRAGDIGRYLGVTRVNEYVDPDALAFVAQLMMTQDGAPMSLVTVAKNGAVDWEASPAGDHIKTMLKRLAKNLPDLAGDVVDIFAPGRGRTVAKVGNGVARVLGASALETDTEVRHFQAAPYSRVIEHPVTTAFKFPLIDKENQEATVAQVCVGPGDGTPAFLSNFLPRLHARPSDFTGPSGGFAFFLAYLAMKEWPIMSGLYSGAVSDFRFAGNTASCILSPVGMTAEKIAVFPSALSVLTPTGYYEQGVIIPLSQCIAFSFLEVQVTPLDHAGVRSYRVVLRRPQNDVFK